MTVTRIFYLFLTACSLVLSCQKSPELPLVKFNWMTNWEEAAKIAAKENKPLLAAFSTEWCPYCQYVEQTVFPKPAIAERLHSFVLLKVDGDLAESQPLMKQHDVSGFPTYILFDPKQKEQVRFQVINNEAEFIAALDKQQTAEKELDEKFDAVKEDDVDKARSIAQEILTRFPNAADAPYYYKWLAESYSSKALQKQFLARAAQTIEDRLQNPKQLDEKAFFLLLDEQVDLLVEIYQKLEHFDKIRPAYLQGAQLNEQAANQAGLAQSRHLIGNVAYYYRKAGQPQKGITFLKRAEKVIPDYWPLHSAFAKTYIEMKEWDLAIAHAEKGYTLAKEVAKSRIAGTLADIYAAQSDLPKAIATLNRAIADLEQMSPTEAGRAVKMKKKLEAAIAEYESLKTKS